MNPICNNPIIRIQNTGASTLTSLKIEFGLKDAPYSTYNWSGELQPMEWEEVTLPDYVYQPADQFVVTISEPNGGADEYELNNTMTSEVAFPVSYPADLIIEFKANNKPNENDWFVYDANGNELYSRTTFTAGTIHRILFTWKTDAMNSICGIGMKMVSPGGPTAMEPAISESRMLIQALS